MTTAHAAEMLPFLIRMAARLRAMGRIAIATATERRAEECRAFLLEK